MATYKKNPPIANVLMGSMRAMGYTFEAAIADIIDNSISAQSKNIKIIFPIDPLDCYIVICDDGSGMGGDELYEAMKYGSTVNNGERTEYDLGRFGLGMKSASLSQCRKLTVASKKSDKVVAYLWDLDFIEVQKDWIIQELDEEEIQQISGIDFLNAQSRGTIVVWEKFDVIEKSTGDVFTTLVSYKDPTATYLSLIFHRFLNAEKIKHIDISINNYHLAGLDPFLIKHDKTNSRKEIMMPINDSKGIERYIIIKPYVLPFQKDLTRDDMKKLGGVESYRTKQGFYIYRNERLIIWGTWFGQAKNELTKNARIKVDIPNTLDDIWGIDIKKQNATIPRKIKNQLKRAVDEVMEIAITSQVYRGRIQNVNEHLDYIWDRIGERDNKYSFKINRNSRVFQLLKEDLNDVIMSKFEMVLEEIENGLPFQQIYIDMSQHRVSDDTDDGRAKDVENKALILIDLSKRMGQTDVLEIIEKLFCSEPFCKHTLIKQKLLEEFKDGNK